MHCIQCPVVVNLCVFVCAVLQDEDQMVLFVRITWHSVTDM